MGVVAILFIGLLVATAQVVAEGIRRVERFRVYILAVLAAFFGGSLVKAIAGEDLAVVSFAPIAVAGAVSGLILYTWRSLALKPQPAPQEVSGQQPVGQR